MPKLLGKNVKSQNKSSNDSDFCSLETKLEKNLKNVEIFENPGKQPTGIPHLHVNGTSVSDDHEKGNCFNHCFQSVLSRTYC